MIHQVPKLEAIDHAVLALIREQRRQLRFLVNQSPARWTGFLRRSSFARAIQGSNSIEGYHSTIDEAVAIVDDEEPLALDRETVQALVGYRNAMTYILQIHADPWFELHPQLIRSLHYMMLSHDLAKLPGQYRTGPIFVVHEPSGERVYEGPDAELVPGLVEELVAQVRAESRTDPLVLGTMAHLNLTMIHPFRDGNGRMARALQTLVLARNDILSPIFSSIEEWLGRNSQAYYDALAAIGRGRWSPGGDALPWVRFCLRAHHQQAAILMRRNREVGLVWDEIARLIERHRLTERVETALIDAAFGYRVTNNRYRSVHGISDAVASRDLRRLTEAGLLVAHGEKRGRFYRASERLLALRHAVRDAGAIPDPYALAGRAAP